MRGIHTEACEDHNQRETNVAVTSSRENGNAVCEPREGKRAPDSSERQLFLPAGVEHVCHKKADLYSRRAVVSRDRKVTHKWFLLYRTIEAQMYKQ